MRLTFTWDNEKGEAEGCDGDTFIGTALTSAFSRDLPYEGLMLEIGDKNWIITREDYFFMTLKVPVSLFLSMNFSSVAWNHVENIDNCEEESNT